MLFLVRIRSDPENKERLAQQNYQDNFDVLCTEYNSNKSWRDFSINDLEIIKQIERGIGG